MGGQDGFSRNVLDYSSDMNALMAGFQYHAKDKMELGIDFGWTQSEASLAPFELPADDYVATHPTMSFDFTNTYTNSNLDSTRIDADLWAKFFFGNNIWLRLRYHYVDYQDDAPYLYDTSGKYQYATAAVGWLF